MKTFFKSLLIAGMCASFSHAFPTRYVQISTNTPTQQTGTINIQGATISTTTATNITITSGITFSPTTAGIRGTTTNDSAVAGFVGQFISSTTANIPAPASVGPTWTRSNSLLCTQLRLAHKRQAMYNATGLTGVANDDFDVVGFRP